MRMYNGQINYLPKTSELASNWEKSVKDTVERSFTLIKAIIHFGFVSGKNNAGRLHLLANCVWGEVQQVLCFLRWWLLCAIVVLVYDRLSG